MAPAANLFSVEPEILAALQPLAERTPADKPLHIGSAINVVGTREIGRFLPGIYVAPAPPERVEDSGRGIVEHQVWDVTCAVRSITGQPNMPDDHSALGQLAATALMAVLAVDDLQYHGRMDIQYAFGHAEITLQFACARALDLTDADAYAALDNFVTAYTHWDLGPDPDGTDEARDDIRVPSAGAIPAADALRHTVRDGDWPESGGSHE